MPFNIGPLELIIILVIALLILGPGRLPEVGASLGKSIREFRKAATDVSEATKVDLSTPPPNTTAPQPTPPQVAAPTVSPSAPPTPNVISDQAAPNEIGTETKV